MPDMAPDKVPFLRVYQGFKNISKHMNAALRMLRSYLQAMDVLWTHRSVVPLSSYTGSDGSERLCHDSSYCVCSIALTLAVT